MEGLVVATIMAGIILIIMGFCRLGNLIKFIPYTITTGFTAGIAVTIFIGQIKDFLGVDTSVYQGQTIDTIGKIKALGAGISAGGISVAALLIGLLSLAISDCMAKDKQNYSSVFKSQLSQQVRLYTLQDYPMAMFPQ